MLVTTTQELTIDIGGMPILVRTDNTEFAHMIEDRYGEFVTAATPHAAIVLEIELVKEPGQRVRGTGHGTRGSGLGVGDSDSGPRTPDPGLRTLEDDEYDQELSVRREAGRWVMERGDFRAEWEPQCHRGWVRQTANPYALDGVLRILHSLILAREGGFLVHAASAVRDGRAFVFAGVSGAGKTTIARLAPPDVTLLTDEISYVRNSLQVTGYRGQESEVGSQESGARSQELGNRSGENRKSQIGNCKSQIDNRQSTIENLPSPESRIPNPVSRVPCPDPLSPVTCNLSPAFSAFGTPFAGELARIGQRLRAPLAALFLLKQGPENRIEPLSEAEAGRELLRHVLFFAHDEELVGIIFQTVCDFVRRVPVRRLVFTKDARVWELIA
ncbi:MAG TPA: hypothetical protein VKO18_06785 [Terriglobia bacterium]|nr:hypothetical protein [Terriglobia bacterium]